MRRNRLAWAIASGVLAAGALLALEACSDNGTTPTEIPPVVDSGRHDSSSSSSDAGADTNEPPPGDAGKECGTAPKLFPPKADGGMFCPFSATDGGKNVYCTLTETCCEAPTGSTSTCVSGKTETCPVAKSTPWQCEDPIDCPQGQKCCAYGTNGEAVTVGTDVCGAYLSKFGGTKCADTCAAGELVVCEEQSECEAGTCTAVRPKANDIGVCN